MNTVGSIVIKQQDAKSGSLSLLLIKIHACPCFLLLNIAVVLYVSYFTFFQKELITRISSHNRQV